MIDTKTISVIENRARQDIEDRRDVFGRVISQIKRKIHLKGMSNSSPAVKLILDAIANEFRVRASLIWHAFARAFDAQRIKLDETLSNDVKQHLSSMLDNFSPDLPKYYKDLSGITSVKVIGKSYQELRKDAVERIYNEIEYAFLRQSASRESESGVINIYQSYGIVQTGQGSSASMAVTLESGAIKEIENALESVKKVIEQSNLISQDNRNQVLELVSDITNEIKRPKPNTFRIRGALEGIALTVQTLGSASQAYQLIKGAASLLGLQLP